MNTQTQSNSDAVMQDSSGAVTTANALKMAIAQLSEYRESQVICATNLGYEEKWAKVASKEVRLSL